MLIVLVCLPHCVRLTWTFKYAGKQTATISVTVARRRYVERSNGCICISVWVGFGGHLREKEGPRSDEGIRRNRPGRARIWTNTGAFDTLRLCGGKRCRLDTFSSNFELWAGSGQILGDPPPDFGRPPFGPRVPQVWDKYDPTKIGLDLVPLFRF